MKYARIGGQAVIEGVMMRCGEDYAVAVRKSDGEIEVKKDRYRGLVARLHLQHIPVLRGMFAFVDSMVLGMSTLTFSAGFYEDEEEEKEAGKDESPSGLMMGLTVAFSILIAVFLFMLTPYFISGLFGRYIRSSFLLALVEGLLRIAIFLIYMIAVSRLKDIQRVFMYHGAEHKTISCIEAGLELTPENAAKCSRLHKRCGTSFLLIVMIVSIVCFMFIRTRDRLLRLGLRIVLIPVIAGISYELIQFAGRSDSPLVNALSAPGLLLQKCLTTREPDRQMLEVAIASIEAIYDWRKFQKEELEDDVSAAAGAGNSPA